ncbi:hypothetical protein QBC35DRAFT_131696 [Podospora australis]|uniref:Uncharacterized protein n=1 Tax=Podospora australis TaxID=1536484 RepID=A0AAN7AEI6_9PEZI|nr:hypothetical protein QBC35DRAFT_131696 [Podospora australis]
MSPSCFVDCPFPPSDRNQVALPAGCCNPSAQPKRNAIHEPGKTYIIVIKDTVDDITLVADQIKVVPLGSLGAFEASWHWNCQEEDGWLKFWNPISKQYFGMNLSHNENPQFCCRPQASGGYFMMITQHENARIVLKKMGVEGTSRKPVLEGLPKRKISRIDGTATNQSGGVPASVWEFIQV